MDSSIASTITATSLFSGAMKQTFRLQNTIDRPAVVQGFGFWTGKDVRLEFHPAPVGTGVVFVRTDLKDEPRIPALLEFREEKPRQTSLARGPARVDMVEHVLAAVRALDIDNCEIHADQPEMPGMDGSAMPFMVELEKAGIRTQAAIRNVRLVTRSFRVGSEQNWIDVMPDRSGRNIYQYTLVPSEDYPFGTQEYSFVHTEENFRTEIMSARTFLTRAEAEYLLEKGLCQRVTPKDVLVLDRDGPVENEFRFSNECVRHKILDMVGDFSLAGCDWVGSFLSYRGGHALNAECVRILMNNTLLLDESFLNQSSDLVLEKERIRNKAA